MAGGGTGGHVIPALAVARELQRRGHRAVFIGTERGVEARLVPQAGFPLEFIRVGGLKGLGLMQRVVERIATRERYRAAIAPVRGGASRRCFQHGRLRGRSAGDRRYPAQDSDRRHGAQCRSWLHESSAPRASSRRALISFHETERFFPAGRTEVTGLPVREEFFQLPAQAGRTRLHRPDHRRQPRFAYAQ